MSHISKTGRGSDYIAEFPCHQSVVRDFGGYTFQRDSGDRGFVVEFKSISVQELFVSPRGNTGVSTKIVGCLACIVHITNRPERTRLPIVPPIFLVRREGRIETLNAHHCSISCDM